MKPGRELDALIAEKVMGWKTETFVDSGLYCKPSSEGQRFALIRLPAFSTDIAVAWEVVGKIDKRFCLIVQEPGIPAKAWFERDMGTGFPVSYGISAPHAICLAALRAVGAAVE